MRIKLGPVSLCHYRFRQSLGVQKTYGFSYTLEEFPSHNKFTHDFSLSYGNGCAYVEVDRKIK